jgi:hypothetical protein
MNSINDCFATENLSGLMSFAVIESDTSNKTSIFNVGIFVIFVHWYIQILNGIRQIITKTSHINNF